MAFYKKQKIHGKWYPRAITKGRPATTDDVAKRLSLMSTVSPGDTYAVLVNLGEVLGELMSAGRSVRLKGVGTFYLTCQSENQGVDTPEEVSPQQITDTKVRFIPEYSRGQNNRVIERTLIDPYLEWVDFDEIGNNSNK
ncbi:HU family DNA-binding protein [Bacteroides sp. MSB163]|uniref:HU family DNA-binding protein n=1 Tax=Bacteroides maternus TaxID=3117552 RepID=UPI0026284DD0|nr:HU family DNA-binding protein [uncultured Bacteroides sp.]